MTNQVFIFAPTLSLAYHRRTLGDSDLHWVNRMEKIQVEVDGFPRECSTSYNRMEFLRPTATDTVLRTGDTPPPPTDKTGPSMPIPMLC